MFIVISTASYLKVIKIGLIKFLLFGCFNLFLDIVHFHDQINILKSILCKNNYLRDFDEKFASNSHKVKMSENLGVSALTGKWVKGDNDSSIKEHNLFCNHLCGFDNLSTLACNNYDFKVTKCRVF